MRIFKQGKVIIHVYMLAHNCLYTCTRLDICACTHICVCMCVCAYIYMHTHLLRYIYIYIHIPTSRHLLAYVFTKMNLLTIFLGAYPNIMVSICPG